MMSSEWEVLDERGICGQRRKNGAKYIPGSTSDGPISELRIEPVKNYDNGEYERFLAACFSYFSARTRRVRPSK